jgi:uncharacterized protein (TIGR02246 family)
MTGDLERDVDRLLAIEEIRTLALRYSAAIEARDVDAMAELFTADARFGSAGQGPDGLRRLMTGTMDGSLMAVVLVANHLVVIDDEDHAHGEVWARCYSQTEQDGYLEQLIKYVDRYRREDGTWRFVHRKHRLWFGVSKPTPFDQPAADWPRSQVGVGDVVLADETFRRWWSARRDDRS